jgi:hypothetical protein
MVDLKAIAGSKYKIKLDESAEVDTTHEGRLWYYQIPCRGKSHIGVWGENTLSAY